jgi:signal peptidase I
MSLSFKKRRPAENVPVSSEASGEAESAQDVRKKQKREIRSFFVRLFTLALITYVIFGVAFGITIVRNNDMIPGMGPGDLVFYYRLKGDLSSGDIVTYRSGGKDYIGRIIAKAGDDIEVTEDAQVMINGYLVSEPKIFFQTPRLSDDVQYPVHLNRGQYFIMCDHREGSCDSRYLGVIEEASVTGKVMSVLRRSDL